MAGRTLVFRAARPHRVLRARRPERAANAAARRELVAELGPLWQNVADRFRAGLDDHRLAATIARGGADLDMVMAAWEGPSGSFLASVFRDAIEAGSAIGARHSGISGGLRTDSGLTARSQRWIEREGGRRISRINGTTRDAVREVLADVLGDGVSPTRAAQDIGRLTGLTPAQSRAVLRYERQLLSTRIPSEQADTQLVRETIAQDVERYRDRLLRQRGETIVETEGQAAVHAGERLWWEEAGAQELVDLDATRKRWNTVADDRVCEVCEPLHGVVVRFDEQFQSLGWLGESPPAHPRCRCFLEYLSASEA